jgi:hypothetical protein
MVQEFKFEGFLWHVTPFGAGIAVSRRATATRHFLGFAGSEGQNQADE